MINVPPGRPVRNSAPRTLEKFHIYLLLVLGIALVGAGLTVIGFATISPAVAGIGAGTLVAAGLIAVYFALAGSRLTVEEKSVPIDDISIAPLTPDPNPESSPSGRRERHGKFPIEIASRTRAPRPIQRGCRTCCGPAEVCPLGTSG
jgi:hypothetical protein